MPIGHETTDRPQRRNLKWLPARPYRHMCVRGAASDERSETSEAVPSAWVFGWPVPWSSIFSAYEQFGGTKRVRDIPRERGFPDPWIGFTPISVEESVFCSVCRPTRTLVFDLLCTEQGSSYV